MKNKAFLIIFSIIVFMIGGITLANGKVNIPPRIPSNPIPEDKSIDVSTTPTLYWNCDDPDGDTLTFDIYFGTSSNPPLVKSDLTNNSFIPGKLKPQTTYYWKVVAKDGRGGETEGPIWNFTTESIIKLKYPPNEVTVDWKEVTLSWEVTDDDYITFDVYLGTFELKPIAQNIPEKSLIVRNLERNATYRWYVVAKDIYGNILATKVNSFKTKPNRIPEIKITYPINNSTNIELKPKITWEASDVDNDELKYNIYLNNTLIAEKYTMKYYELDLKPNAKYTLKIEVEDEYGGKNNDTITFSTTRSPSITLLSPEIGKIITGKNAELKWEASDPDGDILTYNLYLSNSATPELYKEGIEKKFIDVELSEYGTYYWMIETVDNKGGKTNSPIWNFTRKKLIVAAGGVEGIFTFDVTDPQNPKLIWHLDTDGNALNVHVSGNYAYVADGENGLLIIDVSDPYNPKNVGHLSTDYADNLYVSGNYVYVIGDDYLVVVDVIDPLNPRIVGRFDTDGYVHDVYVLGKFAYIAQGKSIFNSNSNNGLVIVDISNPANPTKIGFLNTENYISGVYVSGNYAYITDGNLLIVDVSDPTNPSKIMHLDTYDAVDLYVSENLAYLMGDGLTIVDISNPKNPKHVGHLDTDGTAGDLHISGNYAYVADGVNGLVIVDITDPGNLKQVGHFDTYNYAKDVYVSGNYAYIADGENGLVIIDVINPREIGHFDTGNANKIYVSGNYVYVADWYNGLVIVDISDPTNPALAGHLTTDNLPMEIYVSGNYAFIAVFFIGLEIVDISFPLIPINLGILDVGIAGANSVYVSGNYAYVTNGNLLIFDVSVPLNPIKMGHLDVDCFPNKVHISGKYAYLLGLSKGLVIVDISDPLNPKQVGKLDTDVKLNDVYVSGNYAYVADGINGLLKIDVSDPANPVLVYDMLWISLEGISGM